MEESNSNKSLWIAGGIGVAIVWFLLFCFRTVGAGQVGIITRFGNVNRQATSGIVVKLPWPIEKLHKMDLQVQKEEQQSAAATSDLQDVNATLALNYALDTQSASKIFKEIGKDYKERIIIPAVQESFKAASATYTAGQLITERTAVKGKAYDVIKERLEKYGVRVIDLNIVNFSFSPQFSAAIEAKQVTAQQAEQARLQAIVAEEQAKAAVATARGQAEAQSLIQSTVTPLTLQKEAVAKWDGKLPTYLGGGTVFNIPLQGN